MRIYNGITKMQTAFDFVIVGLEGFAQASTRPTIHDVVEVFIFLRLLEQIHKPNSTWIPASAGMTVINCFTYNVPVSWYFFKISCLGLGI